MTNTITLPAITLAINLAFATTTDFENRRLANASIVALEAGTNREQYVFCSEYYGLFIDARVSGDIVRFCFGNKGIEEIFAINAEDVHKRVYIKIRYGKSIDDAYITARNNDGINKSVNFRDIPESLKRSIIELNSKQFALETAFGM